MKLALLESSIDIVQVLSGKKNLDTPVKKPTTSTPSATRPNQPEEKEMQLPVEKATPDKEPESISEPKDESHSTLSLETITQSWGNIIDELEKNNSKIAHFLEDATLKKFDGSHLWI